jgi:hypothetical protein
MPNRPTRGAQQRPSTSFGSPKSGSAGDGNGPARDLVPKAQKLEASRHQPSMLRVIARPSRGRAQTQSFAADRKWPVTCCFVSSQVAAIQSFRLRDAEVPGSNPGIPTTTRAAAGVVPPRPFRVVVQVAKNSRSFSVPYSSHSTMIEKIMLTTPLARCSPLYAIAA